jgi:hypothetical protein
MTLLDRVAALLDAQNVPHAMIGAAALAAAGVARSTYDVDLLTVDAAVLRDTLWAPLRDAGVSVDIRRGDADDPLAGVVRCEISGDRPVDLIVGRHAWQGRAVERATRFTSGPPIVRPGDLILLKLYAGGTQDLWDIRELIALPASDDIVAYVEREIAAMAPAMRERWSAIRR